jgi:formate dehydrogenase subunit gamma
MTQEGSRRVADDKLIRSIVSEHASRPGALLPILHAVQDALGYVPDSAVPIIAQALNLSRAEVHGVVSFYHFFRSSPPGKQVLYLCRAEACQARGSRELERYVQDKLGVSFHETTADGRFTLEPIYCLGNCACAPALMIDDEVRGRATPALIDALVGSS